MRAAWLEKIGKPLEIREVPDPEASPSGVVVRVLAVRVPSYTRKVIDGSLGYDIHPPLIPGPACIGQVESIGADVFDLAVGNVVLCNSLLSSGGGTSTPDEILIGWTGSGSERSRRMQQFWPNGSFAQMAHYPARCLTVLPEAEKWDRTLLPFLASLAIADGGLRRGELESGQTVVINGATGQLGGAGVLLALAHGAARVVATGRNRDRLKTLAEIDSRILVHELQSRREKDSQAIIDLAQGPVDLAMDYLAHTPTPDPTLAAFDTLRLGGKMILVGGVRHDLPLPYGQIMRRQLTIRGSFMFDRNSALLTWNMVRSGLVDLPQVKAHAFLLEDMEQAIDRALTLGGLDYALLLPNGSARFNQKRNQGRQKPGHGPVL
jgi:NADPH:quinone reductase-like Zn-dependent oxidoreductase